MAESRINITGFTLKVLAILGMTANHLAHAFIQMFPIWVTGVLYSFGGLTFPIMAYLIVEGYLHTSNLRNYAKRLFIFALVSQVPFSLLFGLELNVLFTLLLGLFLIWAWDNIESKALFALLLICALGVSWFCDWKVQGPLIAFMFYLLREYGTKGVLLTMLIPYSVTILPVIAVLPGEIQQGFIMGANAVAAGIQDSFIMLDIGGGPLVMQDQTILRIFDLGYALIGFTLSTFFICHYNGMRGRPMKWFFYVYYPAHLLIIWGVHWLLVNVPVLIG